MNPDDPTAAPLRVAFYHEPNTKRAAALLTVGVPFFSDKDNERTTNTYTEDRPFQEGVPGHVKYILSTATTSGVAAEDLSRAFNDSTFAPARELDDLANEIEKANPALGKRLKTILPFAIVSYLRGGAENRERIIDLWKKAKPMVLIRRGENAFTLVERDASEKVLQRYGLK